MNDIRSKMLQEEQLRSMRPASCRDEPLSPAEQFSLLPAKMSTRELETEAIRFFSPPASTLTYSALEFVADELGIKSTALHRDEVLLALHYISIYGGGYNERINRLVVDVDPCASVCRASDSFPWRAPVPEEAPPRIPGRGPGVGGGITQ